VKVCIIRNAEVESNASMNRIIDALLSIDIECVVLSRSRYKNKGLIRKQYRIKNKAVETYEIQIKTEFGRGLSGIFQLIRYQFNVLKWLIKNKKKYNIIHAFDLDAGLPSIIAAKMLKKRLIYHIADFYVDSRGGIPKKFQKTIKKVEYFIINNSEVTIVCTEDRKEQIHGSRPKKLYVIHNVPNIKKTKPRNDNDQLDKNKQRKNIVFTYVGSLSETRFIKQVLNIFKRNPQFTLVIAGIGKYADYVKEHAKDYKNIVYYGKVDYNKALELYAKTDIMFAMYDPKVANHKFAAPNKIYESMAMGKPIIVAEKTGLSNLVRERNMGWVINYTEKDFENLILSLDAQKNLLDIKGKNASKAYADFSWQKTKNEIINLYSEIRKDI